MDRDQLAVGLRDGVLRVHQWGTPNREAPVVLAVHGISGNGLSWAMVAERLPGVRVLAPDLRGRGGSNELPGPFGMARHADDLAELLDRLEIPQAVVVGHSMGGFVSVVLRHRHPDRVAGLLLVDGGLPLPVPVGTDAEQLTKAILGPALARLTMTFPDRDSYRAYWQAHPAFAVDWGSAVEAYVDYDLVGQPPHLHSSVRPEAVREDSLDHLEGFALRDAVAALADQPLTFLRAPRGLQDEPPGLYPEALLRGYDLPGLRWTTVPDVNHYTILLSARGADAVAGAVRGLLPAGMP
jgi:pimeloyl-ACP methyl ester carboxylesterase